MTIIKCIAIFLLDILVFLITGIILFADGSDAITIPSWYAFLMVAVASGSAYIVARSGKKKKSKRQAITPAPTYNTPSTDNTTLQQPTVADVIPEGSPVSAGNEAIIHNTIILNQITISQDAVSAGSTGEESMTRGSVVTPAPKDPVALMPADQESSQKKPIDYDAFFEQVRNDEEEWRRQQLGLSPVDNELRKIDYMDGHAFEYWCAELLKKRGFQNVEVTQGSNDQGVDVFAVKDGIKYAIQCKCYTNDLGNKPVQEVNTGKAIYHCHVGVVMTNRYFTSGAIEAAAATGTLLWGRNELERWIGETLGVNNVQAPTVRFKMGTTPQGNDYDPLLKQAVDVILETNQASVAMIQRRFKLGYGRTARIIDQLEELHIVGEYNGSIPRKILVKENPLK